MTILLIYPPLTNWDSPYLGLALLSAHLRSRAIPHKLLDMNGAFCKEFPSAERIAAGLEYADHRLAELHGKDELQFIDVMEYIQLGMALRWRAINDNGMKVFAEKGLRPTQAMSIADVMTRLQVAALPWFPEHMSLELHYVSAFSEYSSAGILASLSAPTLFDGFFERQLKSVTGDKAPRIVGLSVFAPSQVIAAFRCATVIRKLMPDTHITIGGSTISCHFRKLDNPTIFDVVDSLVMDEGELPLERLWEELDKPEPRLETVPSLVWRDDGRVRRNELAPRLGIEGLPLPEYEVFPEEQYGKSREDLCIPLRLSKGCGWQRCAFCRTGLPLVADYRHASADFLFEQIRELHGRGYRKFGFVNESPDARILEALCRRLIEENIKLEWHSTMRFDPRVTLECAMTYRQSGCKLLCMGLENLNDRVLKLMRKGINVALVERVMMNLSWAGVPLHVNMIVGFPTETEEEARASFALLQEKTAADEVAKYAYFNFTLIADSAVMQDPESFGVKDISVPKDYDLDPPVRSFTSPGLTRHRAAQLEFEFNGQRDSDRSLGKALAAFAEAGEVALDGHRFKLAYDPRELLSHIERLIVTTSCGAHRIEVGRATIPPLKPQRRA